MSWLALYSFMYEQSMNQISLKNRFGCYAKSPTGQDTFWPIPGLISCTEVTGRWGLLYHAQNVVRWLALSKVDRSSLFVSFCASLFIMTHQYWTPLVVLSTPHFKAQPGRSTPLTYLTVNNTTCQLGVNSHHLKAANQLYMCTNIPVKDTLCICTMYTCMCKAFTAIIVLWSVVSFLSLFENFFFKDAWDTYKLVLEVSQVRHFAAGLYECRQ